MQEYLFGIDLGGTTAKIGFFDTQGKIFDKWEIPTKREEMGKYIIEDLANAILIYMNKKGLVKSQICGIGIGVPGPVDSFGKVKYCPNLGWGEKFVEKELQELTGINVRVGNDGNIAALGEMWQGGGKGYKNILMVTLGTGVGGGLICDEHLICGAHGAGGEIGHIIVNPHEKRHCGCGGCGCLEFYASATGIVRMAKEYAAEHKTTRLLGHPEITAKIVFEEAKNGDEIAGVVVDCFGKYLAKALASVSVIADPEVFIIGGGVSKAGQIVIDVVQKHFVPIAFKAVKDTSFVLATLGNDAGIYGAARLLI